MANTEAAPPMNRTWDLNIYESNRATQEVIADETEIAVSPKSLHSELMCPICLDMLKTTMTTKECLHRFCNECITTALRSGNKECPTCRKKLVSRRSLRPDPNFDALIASIYPNREEYEAFQERAMQNMQKAVNPTNALSVSIREGIAIQTYLRQNSAKKHLKSALLEARRSDRAAGGFQPSPLAATPPEITGPNHHHSRKHLDREPKRPRIDSPMSVTSTASTLGDSESESTEDAMADSEIELVFKPHPSFEHFRSFMSRYLKTTANATVSHMEKYLRMRVLVENGDDHVPSISLGLSIHICPGGSRDGREEPRLPFILLNGKETLCAVHSTHWGQNRPMELYYSMNR